MGDRCAMELTFPEPDGDAVKDVFGEWECEHGRTALPGCLTVELWEVNYGGHDDLALLAARGLAFLGHHTVGDEYGPKAFAACDGQIAMIDADHFGWPVVHIDPDTGGPDPQDREATVAYVERRREALTSLGRNVATSP